MTPTHRNSRRARVSRGGINRTLALSMLVITAVSAGCQSNSTTSAGPSTTSKGGSQNASLDTGPTAAVVAEVERSHVVGPIAAGEMNYRVAWQFLSGNYGVKLLTVEGDSVFLLDLENFLTRIKIADGNRLWRMQVAETIDHVLGINFPGDRVYVTTSGSVLVLDANTGSQVQRQPLQQIANTEPVQFGPYLIYGSRNGQIVWHSGAVGQHWKGYQVAHSLHVPPVLEAPYLAAVADDGTVIVLNPSSVRQYWSRRLLAPVVCTPAIGDQAIYIAGKDQYLWAYDLSSGRNIWKVLTESELVDSPVLIDERVYQHIPGFGLHCYHALPWDHPGGLLMWKNTDVAGNVLFKVRGTLYVWDDDARRMSLVDDQRGSLVKTVDLAKASRILAAGGGGTELYVASDDGRIVRLVPRN